MGKLVQQIEGVNAGAERSLKSFNLKISIDYYYFEVEDNCG